MLAALALVAVAARGSTSAGGSGVRRPSELLLDFLVSLYIVMLGLGAVMVIVLLVLRRHVRRTELDPKKNAFRSLLVVSVFVTAGFLLLRLFELRDPQVELPQLRPQPTSDEDATTGAVRDVYEAEFAWLPMLVLGLLVLAGGLAWWRAGKARGRARGARGKKPTLAETLADVLAETLEGLRAEPDPRRAVIRAYARLERMAAASGVARRPAEAPLEYLGRLLSGLDVGPAAVRRLTSLFERAKFSHHAIDESMKQEAIAALESVQEDLRQAELRAQQQREAAIDQMREQARQRASEQARV